MFSSVRRVCARTSPTPMYSLVAGSIGPWPDTWRNPPLCTACEKTCAAAGAPSVSTTFFSLMRDPFGGGPAQVGGDRFGAGCQLWHCLLYTSPSPRDGLLS